MKVITLFIIIFCALAFAMDKPAYILYNAKGKKVDYDKMINRLSKADVVLFGELHNNALVHWLQQQVVKDLQKQNRSLVLGAEMFEADDQLIVNEYLNGLIEARHLESEAKVWDNYATDYKPLIDFAKQHNYPFIATNIPRRYASLVSREGLQALDSLLPEAQSYIAPLPVEVDLELPSYQNMLEMMQGHGNSGHSGMNGENMVNAQAIKDATMAHFIQQNLQENSTFVHFNGSYHSDRFEGIYWYLKELKPDLDIVIISSVEQEDISSWDERWENVADYIISIPADMTKTY
ncbi:ChaN family lipoprotein [Catalinimonas niigatensis]|uniref:ChaN family lipoprotein n=1 Tax=Catalinimonas niigatensis TaxID=1397264 RepID=UPI002666DD8C|nr:ChaN family lipoprotein [Catalinimonas niigatensis]WPP48052.1 ChaN family lipoprotein [Catalinimonas niigatensis]